ncbi:hypothetical protein Tsubulata_050841 [Turnera subulata]|uniref:Fatty acid desaturase domain-containing protein n=1 Tax=Turnera subulata TaxID=218843 RepID=A0A9Q0J4N1_9ROSI|nr:hypothetical protein Tsubulata_050841 [Turnera subulata]
MPYLVHNALVVTIVYLHHTHPDLPHYDSSEWDWLRGALSTVDRDYGFLLNTLFHNITDAHVVHHLISTIPHYHAVEATKAIKPILGDYYQSDDTPLHKALWRSVTECVYVGPDEGAPSQGFSIPSTSCSLLDIGQLLGTQWRCSVTHAFPSSRDLGHGGVDEARGGRCLAGELSRRGESKVGRAESSLVPPWENTCGEHLKNEKERHDVEKNTNHGHARKVSESSGCMIDHDHDL